MLNHNNPELLTMGRVNAMMFVPKNPTILIGIVNDHSVHEQAQKLVMEKPDILDYKLVRFDDIENGDPEHRKIGKTIINESHVTEICTFIELYLSRVQAILVHCSKGENRSPSVAMAISELYGIPYLSQEEFREKYKEYNRTVYKTMLEVGKKLQGINP